MLALAATTLFGLRSYRTLVLLQSARSLGATETSSIRAWMTLRYVADAYRVDRAALAARLALPPPLIRRRRSAC